MFILDEKLISQGSHFEEDQHVRGWKSELDEFMKVVEHTSAPKETSR